MRLEYNTVTGRKDAPMRIDPVFPLRVFYDGSCPVCGSRVERYGRQDRAGRLILVDVSAPEFDPAPFGIPLTDFMSQMHVLDRSGRVYRGVDAFRAIWRAFPASRWPGLCGALITLPLVNPVARLAYRVFARLRVYLPKRHRNFASGSCRIDR